MLHNDLDEDSLSTNVLWRPSFFYPQGSHTGVCNMWLSTETTLHHNSFNSWLFIGILGGTCWLTAMGSWEFGCHPMCCAFSWVFFSVWWTPSACFPGLYDLMIKTTPQCGLLCAWECIVPLRCSVFILKIYWVLDIYFWKTMLIAKGWRFRWFIHYKRRLEK